MEGWYVKCDRPNQLFYATFCRFESRVVGLGAGVGKLRTKQIKRVSVRKITC